MQLEIRERSVGDVVILEMFGKITIGEGSVQLRDAVGQFADDFRRPARMTGLTAEKVLQRTSLDELGCCQFAAVMLNDREHADESGMNHTDEA